MLKHQSNLLTFRNDGIFGKCRERLMMIDPTRPFIYFKLACQKREKCVSPTTFNGLNSLFKSISPSQAGISEHKDLVSEGNDLACHLSTRSLGVFDRSLSSYCENQLLIFLTLIAFPLLEIINYPVHEGPSPSASLPLIPPAPHRPSQQPFHLPPVPTLSSSYPIPSSRPQSTAHISAYLASLSASLPSLLCRALPPPSLSACQICMLRIRD